MAPHHAMAVHRETPRFCQTDAPLFVHHDLATSIPYAEKKLHLYRFTPGVVWREHPAYTLQNKVIRTLKALIILKTQL